MKYKIEFLPSASEDLKYIEDWYRLNFDIQAAAKVKNAIMQAIRRLETFPDSGSQPNDEWIRLQGFRMVIAGRHIVFYRKLEDCILIYHVADSRTEYWRLFL